MSYSETAEGVTAGQCRYPLLSRLLFRRTPRSCVCLHGNARRKDIRERAPARKEREAVMLYFDKRSKEALILCCLGMLLLLTPGHTQQQQGTPGEQSVPLASREQLESLIAPIALYPDELLGQILVASTYPLEIVQLSQWMEKNGGLKDKALVDAVKKQNWDASVQALVAFPDVVKQLSGNIQWTTDLGNAVLAQQSDVMDAVQNMRGQAKSSGKLESNEQQKVKTEVVENKTVVVIEPTNPEVVYVPTYSPTAVWGATAYPYPPIAYPPAGYVATGLISFAAGVATRAAWGHGWGGGWGWGCGWGDNDININNNFVRNNNLNASRTDIARNRNTSSWRHNSQHRGGAPYPNRQTANRFGGSADRQQARVRGQRQGSLGSGDRSLARRDFAGAAEDRIGNREIRSPSFERSGAFGGIERGGGFERASSSRGRSSLGGHSFSGGRRGGRR